MTDSRGCAQVRDLAVEVALGVATAEDRVLVLGHVITCVDCRAHLAELSTLVDDMLRLVPPAEPPTGFESAVLARYEEGGTPWRVRRVGGGPPLGVGARAAVSP